VPMVRSASFSEVLFPMPVTHPYDPAEPSTGCQPTQKRFITPRRATHGPHATVSCGQDRSVQRTDRAQTGAYTVVVRSLLVPALVAIMGRWNWCLPAGAARILQIPPTT
jgi:hypothetical protein